jgi:hypothetical protein
MEDLSVEYFVFIFIAALGIYQLAAAYSGLKGISFFPNKNLGYIFTGIAISPTFIGLFTWNQRNGTGIVEGAQQFGLFCLAVFLAFLFTVVFSHFLQKNRLSGDGASKDGLEALKEATYFQALKYRFIRKENNVNS